MKTGRVLICEEEPEARKCLGHAVDSLGYSVRLIRNENEVLSCLETSEDEISALLFGMAMPGRDDFAVLREIRAIDANLPVIVIAGSWSGRDVVTALRNGATDFLFRPIAHEEAIGVLTSALGTSEAACRSVPRGTRSPWDFKSANPRIKEIESRVGRIGWSEVPVLIQGETGSGKEVLARKLHAQSTRTKQPFLKLNCAALPSELVESELFGYERGSFTGAFERKAGIFELADGGTILLDEIGDMDIRLQAKLLQVLQDQEFRRIGGKEIVKVNVRIMAATHRDLEKAISERAFREDLFYRLNVIVLQVPPLRERTEDIVPLGEFFIRKHSNRDGSIPAIGIELTRAMKLYNWPGNVRELENCMRKLVIFRDPDALASDLQAQIVRKPPTLLRLADSQDVRVERRDDLSILEKVTKNNRQAETDAILAALDSTRWNRKQAAAILKTEYKSLLYKMRKLGIDDGSPSLSGRPRPPLQRAASGD